MTFQTEVALPDRDSLLRAAMLLRNGEVVGMPTETVYGLAANAYDTAAIGKIFAAKGRPQDNPLIVHIDRLDQLSELVSELPQLALNLAAQFWPGPLTMILPKADKVPLRTTGGLSTVAVRMPSHPTARALIEACGFPLAAPSANLSGRPSPTTAAHVLQDMAGKIPLILDGGSCEVGLESTVIAVYPDKVRLLRPGGITKQMLEPIAPVEVDDGVLHQLPSDAKAASPGMKYKHYAPKANVILLDGTLEQFCRYVEEHPAPGLTALLFDGEEDMVSVPALSYGSAADAASQAHRLFDCLRQLDERGAQTVYARCPQKDGVGLAVYNRLIRAAGFTVITL